MQARKYIKSILIILLTTLFTVSVFAENSKLVNYAGSGRLGLKDGKKEEADLRFPYGLVFDKNSELLIIDSQNNRVRKVTENQVITFAGTTEQNDDYGFPQGGYYDSGKDQAQFNQPRYAALDSKGNIYISDTGNHVIRKISNGKVFTFAGTGEAGYKDGTAKTSQFNTPSGIAVDSQDNLYIADSLNHVIRKITPKGEVSTFAGIQSDTPGFRDGDARIALFNEPADIDFDQQGALYVSDSGNQVIRKIVSGKVTTIAGKTEEIQNDTGYAEGGFENGFRTSAKFNFPKGIDVAENGTIFVADTWNHRIRAVKPDGSVVTIAGTGVPGCSEGDLTEAMLNRPVDVVYTAGKLYISDMWNNRICTIPFKLEEVSAVTDRTELIQGIHFDFTTDEIQVWLNKKRVTLDTVKPFVSGSNIFVPVDPVLTAWGAKVKWFDNVNRLWVKKGETVKRYTYSPEQIYLKDGCVMIRIQELADIMKARVEWYREYNAVVIAAVK